MTFTSITLTLLYSPVRWVLVKVSIPIPRQNLISDFPSHPQRVWHKLCHKQCLYFLSLPTESLNMQITEVLSGQDRALPPMPAHALRHTVLLKVTMEHIFNLPL